MLRIAGNLKVQGQSELPSAFVNIGELIQNSIRGRGKKQTLRHIFYKHTHAYYRPHHTNTQTESDLICLLLSLRKRK
jgi:DNA topoisomerase VI subunit A